MTRLAAAAILFFGLSPASAALPDEGFSLPLQGGFAAILGQMQAVSPRPPRHLRMEETPFSVEDAPDASPFSVRGADISEWQGEIAWDQVKTSGLSFVFMKATEGGDFVDPSFKRNWAGASSAGLAKGAYHFYNFCRDGASQAANFLGQVPVEAGTLPPVVDLEQSNDCSKMPVKAAFRADLAVFVAKIQAAYGQAPILYVNYSIFTDYFAGEGDSYKIWIADVSHRAPSMPGGGPWALWQYGWHGRVAGIPGEVDLDVFNGTPDALASLERPSGVMLASLKP